MIKEKEIENRIEIRCREILGAVPFLTTGSIQRESLKYGIRPDLQIELSTGDRTLRIIIEVKAIGEPRIVRSAIQQLKEYVSNQQDAYGLVAAPYISTETARLCKENNTGYIDLAGNCLISFDRIYIERQNYVNPDVEKRTVRSIFSPKSSRILRVLLNNPGREWQVQQLAKEAGISLGLTSRIKERLLDLEYVRDVNKVISINNPMQLLEKWVDNYSFLNNRMYDYFSFDSPRQTENKLAQYCKQNGTTYALSLFSGAALVAPYTRYNRGFAYVKANIPDLAAAMELKPVDSGPNFSILEPYDDGVFYANTEMEEMSVVSDIQLYLDLVSYKGRGEEAAKFLLEQRIRPRW